MKDELLDMPVTINGKKVTLKGKTEYIFVDIYNVIDFDPSESNGRSLITMINGQKCGYSDTLQENDEVEIRWSSL